MKMAAALDEGLKYIIDIKNPRQISRSEDGMLVHVTGVLQTDEVSQLSCEVVVLIGKHTSTEFDRSSIKVQNFINFFVFCPKCKGATWVSRQDWGDEGLIYRRIGCGIYFAHQIIALLNSLAQ